MGAQKKALIFKGGVSGKKVKQPILKQNQGVSSSISIVVNTVPAKDLLLILAELNQANIIISADEINAISLNVEGVSWGQIFELTIKKAGLHSMEACDFRIVSGAENMRNIEPALMALARDCPQGKPLSFSLNAVKLAKLLGLIGEFLNKPLRLESNRDTEIALYLKQQPWPLVLNFIALLYGLDVALQTGSIIVTKSVGAL